MEELKPILDKLTELAAQLNALSDELAKPIDDLDEHLKKLNLGLNCFLTISDPGAIAKLSIGYAKVDRWGLVLSRTERDVREDWLFNNAPRWLRLRGVRFIPALFEAMVKATEAAVKKTEEKTILARDIVKAITENKP